MADVLWRERGVVCLPRGRRGVAAVQRSWRGRSRTGGRTGVSARGSRPGPCRDPDRCADCRISRHGARWHGRGDRRCRSCRDDRLSDHRGYGSRGVVGFDIASGLGLLRAAEPLAVKPIPIGTATALTEKTPVVVAASGGPEAVLPAVVVSRRDFVGYWEYLLDDAIFTAPPHPAWSGAALLGPDGKLAGIGSLVVSDAKADLPGNMFVPIDRCSRSWVICWRSAGPRRHRVPGSVSICGSWTASSSSAASRWTARATRRASATAIG